MMSREHVFIKKRTPKVLKEKEKQKVVKLIFHRERSKET